MPPAPSTGDPVRVEMTKWGRRPHWQYDATWLGSDEHGDWLGIPAGSYLSRPGAAFHAEADHVTLVPPEASGSWWAAAFYAPGSRVQTYVDMTTVPRWDGAVLRAVDLDLDVVRLGDGTVYVDDEDEFAEHRVRLGYPPDVVAGAEASCAWVLDAVRRGAAPFDGSAQAWLDVLRVLREVARGESPG